MLHIFRYREDIVRTIKGDPNVVLQAANKLDPNLQFTVETPNQNYDSTFLENNIIFKKVVNHRNCKITEIVQKTSKEAYNITTIITTEKNIHPK